MAQRFRPDVLSITGAAIRCGAPEIVARAMQPLDLCLLELAADRKGLTEAEAARRLQRDGFNEIKLRHAFNIPTALIAAGFWLPLMIVAMLLLVWSGRTMMAILLIAAVVLSAGLALLLGNAPFKPGADVSSTFKNPVRVKRQLSSSATSSRDSAQAAAISSLIEVSCRQLVVGDIIELSAPAMTGYAVAGAAIADVTIPADVRILSANQLIVDQSAIIEGSPPRVIKHAETPSEPAPQLIDLSNIGFMGSRIHSGSATAVVIATGSRTYRARCGSQGIIRHC
jgi:Mg2+-importing ATPase